ncbi:GNAT family N-acetyltransferase [Pseudomonas syringae]|nr:GNAT family N-acetyltransferase [Pseudomonas syringae]EPM82284.1 GCN5-like N-acetyltransferase [Pseudomonas syringae pv. actinidiae ICMP 19068]NVL30828.1 GNAT family N-acetyltransferase [Pseudomonas syringae pv. actinidiae]NVL37245.1 GNAT family N-acetyltransferase [Pseudomonas syringae pv. actinidiae]NVL52390.1 GNAT family N-acetyltransferase [Pseudomonas syringae pv. actinidiae]NVL55042.1 GNAT family N-acetyltransferase [Pseudomonas syringae pv. actinidiae]
MAWSYDGETVRNLVRGEQLLTTFAISASEDLRDFCLRERYRLGYSPRTKTFAVLREGVEIGLLIYEDWGPPQGYIYEVFVLPEFRGKGVGAWMLAQAERIARELGCTSVKLEPRSLDRLQHTNDALISWYERKGYVQCDQDGSKWVKSLSPL